MTTDFRALCDELLDEVIAAPLILDRELIARARAALAEADGPAVPDGREPASVATQPSDRELLELMPETMRDEFAYAAKVCSEATGGQVKPRIFRVCLNTAALEYARAALSRWGCPAAAPVPEPGEVEGIAEWLNSRGRMADLGTRDWYFRPAAAPVPASERLPGPEDCDEQGRYWGLVMGCEAWVLAKGNPRLACITHWLPANALPLPAPKGGESQP